MQSRERIFKYSNAVVRVHMPDLADDERERRMKEISRAAETILKGVVRNDAKRTNPKVY